MFSLNMVDQPMFSLLFKTQICPEGSRADTKIVGATTLFYRFSLVVVIKNIFPLPSYQKTKTQNSFLICAAISIIFYKSEAKSPSKVQGPRLLGDCWETAES